MADTGYNSPGTMANYDDGGATAWVNVNNAKTQDDGYASCNLAAIKASQLLRASNFGFSVPTDATIVGIVAEADRYMSYDGAGSDFEVYLLKAGSEVGNNKASGTWSLSDDDTYKVFGSSTNLWGTTWTPTEINNSGFGISFKTFGDTTSTTIFYVDHIRIKVYYTTTNINSVNKINYSNVESIMFINKDDIENIMGIE